MKTSEEKGIGMRSLVHNTLGVKGACWGFKIGTRKNDKRVNCSHGSAQNKQQIGWCIVVAMLVHRRTTSIHELTRFTTAQTWGKPSPSTL